MSFTVKDILEMEVTLALGCTEPVAIALGAAAAAAVQAALFSLHGVNVKDTGGMEIQPEKPSRIWENSATMEWCRQTRLS